MLRSQAAARFVSWVLLSIWVCIQVRVSGPWCMGEIVLDDGVPGNLTQVGDCGWCLLLAVLEDFYYMRGFVKI